jgi:uncharacterized protein (TIGR00299 family) protein
MFLGALVDLGYPMAALRRAVAALDLDGIVLSRRRVTRGGIGAVRVAVRCAPDQPHRGRKEIRAILRRARLDSVIRRRSLEVFEALIEVEAGIHRLPPDRIHLHEVGALDALADVVGTVTALTEMGVRRMDAGPVNVGSGTVQCAHGTLPVPAPATAALLTGVPVFSQGDGERTTPTGAALLKVLAHQFGPLPHCTVLNTGYGAGHRDGDDLPNILGLMGGRLAGRTGGPDTPASLVEIRTQIDDMDPRIFGYLSERLLEQGARDVYLCPVYMKKGRPGTLVVVLADAGQAGNLGELLLRETTTLGYRVTPVTRVERPRRVVRVATTFGPVRVKVGDEDSDEPLVTPEYEDCRKLARRHGKPLRTIMAAALEAWQRTAATRRRTK